MATCAVCGYDAVGSFRFCPECGAQADGRAREQRKVVTVLFCDVAGSTALGESLDAEALRTLGAPYFERRKSIVERHGGLRPDVHRLRRVLCLHGEPGRGAAAAQQDSDGYAA